MQGALIAPRNLNTSQLIRYQGSHCLSVTGGIVQLWLRPAWWKHFVFIMFKTSTLCLLALSFTPDRRVVFCWKLSRNSRAVEVSVSRDESCFIAYCHSILPLSRTAHRYCV